MRFVVEKQWKGSLPDEVVLHDADPRGDCEGIGFESGKEYVVLVRSRYVTKDVPLVLGKGTVLFRDMWDDVVKVGTRILISEFCSNISEITSDSGQRTIRELGNQNAQYLRSI